MSEESAPGRLIRAVVLASIFVTAILHDDPCAYAGGEDTSPDRGPAERRVAVEAEAAAFGTVIGPDEKPIAQARARLIGRGSRPPSESDAQGRFTFAHLEPGTYKLCLWAEGYGVVEVAGVEVELGEGADLGTVVLEPAVELPGRVIDAAGEPVVGALVRIRSAASRLGLADRSVTSDEQGDFKIGSLSRGEVVELSVVHEGYRNLAVTLDVTERRKRLELLLTPGSGLGGLAVDSAGRPVAGALITVERRVVVRRRALRSVDSKWGGRVIEPREGGHRRGRQRVNTGDSTPAPYWPGARREHGIPTSGFSQEPGRPGRIRSRKQKAGMGSG